MKIFERSNFSTLGKDLLTNKFECHDDIIFTKNRDVFDILMRPKEE